jgi:hypothetical protein
MALFAVAQVLLLCVGRDRAATKKGVFLAVRCSEDDFLELAWLRRGSSSCLTRRRFGTQAMDERPRRGKNNIRTQRRQKRPKGKLVCLQVIMGPKDRMVMA